MIDYSCSACDELRQTDPNFVVNGLGDTECASLGNNTGLNPSSGNDDCEDLNAMNDCLVKNMETEIDSYNVCNWKEYMKALVDNLWTMFKGIICSICGLWERVSCVYDSLVNLIDAIGGGVGGQSFVRYYRDNSGQDTNIYWWRNLSPGDSHILDIYMDCDVDDPGSTPADRDYVVIIHNCTNFEDFKKLELDVTFYSSGDTRDISIIRRRQAQHPGVSLVNLSEFDAFSWTTSGAVLIKQGEHVKVEAHVSAVNGDSNTRFRLHQFALTWIPINVDHPIDPSHIIVC